jgi:amino acid adenylation domain-containing protein
MPFERAEIEQSIPARFAWQVESHEPRPAVTMGEVIWTYGTLNRAANRLAHRLLARAEAPAPVVLLIEQSVESIAAILGVLKAGMFYVPLESHSSPALLQAVLHETQAPLLLTAGAGDTVTAAVAGQTTQVLRVEDILAGDGPEDDPEIVIAPDAFAYIYFTSGSTGRPKGVVDTHRNVLHNVRRYTNTLRISPSDRLSLVPSPGFSGAVSSLFGALLAGAAVLPFDVRRQGAAVLGAWVARERVTIYHSVPALFRQMAVSGERFPHLRLIRLEGDQMTRRDWELYRERFPETCTLVNGLGATECGLVRQFFIDAERPVADGVVPIGYPVEDMEVLVLDDRGQPVESGAVGEVAVRSRYLAAGYWKRPDLTRAAFRDDPGHPGVRVYRTGDLGRMRPDGCLEYLGRKDFRVKLRGEWVDVADVEAALLGVDGVREAAAAVHGGADDARLVGYIVPEDEAPTVSAVRQRLAATLPAVMVPSLFVVLQRLPLTPNGKLDRHALPPPPPERPRLDDAFVAPGTDTERVLAGIWSEVLGLHPVGVHDRFFDLGGDSLRMSRVQSRIRERLGFDLAPVVLFEHPTIHALARHLHPDAPTASRLAGVEERARRQRAAAARFRDTRPKP